MTIRTLSLPIALSLVLAACTAAPTGPERTVGFLKDYSKLESDPDRPGNWVWHKPGVDMRVYDRLIIEDVQVIPDSESTVGEYGPEKLKKAATWFHLVLIEKVDPFYTTVKFPATNVLRVKIALTDMVPARGETPGEAAIEVDISDSITGDTLAAAVLRIRGSLAGTGDVRVKEEWRHVDGAFQEWAAGLLDYMDRNQAGE
jgi:hypothetical protein